METRRAILIFSVGLLSACSTTLKPCSTAGDTSWEPAVQGHMRCEQKPLRDGTVVNDGLFQQWRKNGKLALEGRFENGKRTGVWTYFDDSGAKLIERRYENGVVVLPTSETQKSK